MIANSLFMFRNCAIMHNLIIFILATTIHDTAVQNWKSLQIYQEIMIQRVAHIIKITPTQQEEMKLHTIDNISLSLM